MGFMVCDMYGTIDKVNSAGSSLTYRWSIQNYSKVGERNYKFFLTSPTFRANQYSIRWNLHMNPETNDDIGLILMYRGAVELNAMCELFIDKGVSRKFAVKGRFASTKDSDFSSTNLDLPQFVKTSFMEDLKNAKRTKDCLNIFLKVDLDGMADSVHNTLKDGRLGYLDDYEELLEDDEFSDITFTVGDMKIQAHKAILAMRSPVFKAMFRHQMQENENNTVKIVDVEYAVLKELFRFMYTGKVRDIDQVASGLLIAAEKYDVQRVKPLCVKALTGNLKINNVILCFAAADFCNLTHLKKEAFDFIMKHGDEIIERDELYFLRPELGREIIRALLAKKMK